VKNKETVENVLGLYAAWKGGPDWFGNVMYNWHMSDGVYYGAPEMTSENSVLTVCSN